MFAVKKMDHAEYQRRMKSKTIEQLRFIVKDAREAADAMPGSENNGYYLDEVHYASAELRRRQNPLGKG